MKSKLAILLLVVVIGVGGMASYVALNPQKAPAWWPRFGTASNPDQVRVSGNIETTEAQVAFKIAGRVERRLVDEGWQVKQGQEVATLDTSDLRCNVDLRRAELQAAKAALAALKAGSRPQEIDAARAAMQRAEHALADLVAGSRPQEIAAAEAALAAAAAERERLQADFRRSQSLYERKTISTEEYDAAKSLADVANERYRQSLEQLKLIQEGSRVQQIDQARAAFNQAKAQYELVKIGPRIEDIQQGEARVAQAEAALKLAETQLSYAVVYSPLTGVVLSKNIEPGEYVSPGTAVVTVGDLVNVWLRAYIEEPDWQRVKFGQRAIVTTDALRGKKFEGRVSFIAKDTEFTPKNVQTQRQRQTYVIRIKIDIHNVDQDLKPGMPADAVIELGSDNAGPEAGRPKPNDQRSLQNDRPPSRSLQIPASRPVSD